MNVRERILGKLRASAPKAPLPVPEIEAENGNPIPRSTFVQELSQRLRAMRAEVIETSEEAWPDALAQVVRTKAIRTILFAPQAASTARAVEAQPSGVSAVLFDRPIWEWKNMLFSDIDAGFTEADSALANVGALIMRTGPNEPRTLSLVPPVHIVLIRSSKIFPDMLSAARSQNWVANMPTNLVMVSGPSKTSDIQQTLAFGAHGPKELVVLLIDEEANDE